MQQQALPDAVRAPYRMPHQQVRLLVGLARTAWVDARCRCNGAGRGRSAMPRRPHPSTSFTRYPTASCLMLSSSTSKSRVAPGGTSPAPCGREAGTGGLIAAGLMLGRLLLRVATALLCQNLSIQKQICFVSKKEEDEHHRLSQRAECPRLALKGWLRAAASPQCRAAVQGSRAPAHAAPAGSAGFAAAA